MISVTTGKIYRNRKISVRIECRMAQIASYFIDLLARNRLFSSSLQFGTHFREKFFFFVFSHPGGSVSLPGVRESGPDWSSAVVIILPTCGEPIDF